ncbi:MAG: DUF2461 domain-containing protein [Bacteroidota bacterium]
MRKVKIFEFLHDLKHNNSKEWMDKNRKRYQEAKEIWLDEIQQILNRLENQIPAFQSVNPKDTIMRINNNRRFNPSLPIYRTYFTFGVSDQKVGPYYHLSISPDESIIGGGLYRPDSDTLKKVREAIDYDAGPLLKTVSTDHFQSFYKGMSKDEQMLKSSPKGYPKDHPQIGLLRRKNLTAIRSLSQKEIIADTFVDLVEEAFTLIQPLNDYFTQAIRFEP